MRIILSLRIFQGASMNLREWMSNSTEFLGRSPKAEVSVKHNDILWNYQCDILQIRGVIAMLCQLNGRY